MTFHSKQIIRVYCKKYEKCANKQRQQDERRVPQRMILIFSYNSFARQINLNLKWKREKKASLAEGECDQIERVDCTATWGEKIKENKKEKEKAAGRGSSPKTSGHTSQMGDKTVALAAWHPEHRSSNCSMKN